MEAPVKDLSSLEEGVEEELWLKRQKIQDLREEYDKKIEELEKVEEGAKLHANVKLEELYKTLLMGFSDGPKPVSQEQLSSIVDTLTKAHADTAFVALTHEMLMQNVELEFRVGQLEVLAATTPTPTSAGNSSKTT